MVRTNVVSSNLRSVGYETITKTLEIEFHSGGIYQYFGIPNSIHSGLMNADSHGTYFDRNIKKAGYRFRKIK